MLTLRLVLVALLYLFLLLVLRMAARGLSFSATTPERSAESALRLSVIEAGTSAFAVGQVIEIAEGETLGRADRADVVVADAAVSAEHARISRIGRAWVVTDLGSTNGTRVNDRPVERQTPLADGDVLGVGTVKLRVLAH